MNRCVTALQKIRGTEDQKTKDAVALLDKICHHTEDKAELKKVYRRQMDASRHEPSKKAYHAKIGVKLATLYAAEGEYSQADSLFHSIEHLLPRDKETARLLDELAKVYSSLAKYDLAESTFNRALEMRESFPGEDRGELMASYANLGASYSVQKDYQMAEMMYKRELESAEEHFGGDNENVITPLMHLAGTYIISGRFAEAEPCYKRILETRYKTQGEGHADLIGSMLHLAELYRIQKNFTEAEIFYESACELAEQVHGPTSLKVAEILDKRAALAKQSEQSELAEELLERAKKVRTEAEQNSSAVLISPGADTAAR
jgi:tetratricopeptide (TPR) repeat protein